MSTDTTGGGDANVAEDHPTRRQDGRAYTPVSEYNVGNIEEDSTSFIYTTAQLFADFFYPAYSYIFGGSQFIQDFERKLRQANIRTTADLYISGALGFGTVLGALFGILMAGIFYVALGQPGIELPVLQYQHVPWIPVWFIELLSPLKIPVAVTFAGVSGGILGVVLGSIVVLPYPYMRASGRKREIDLLLPDVVAFMYSLSVGGMNQLEILESVANAEDVYGECSVEFQRIVQETKYFGVDYQTSIENIANSTPSEDLRKFLIDTLSIINSGGAMTMYLAEQKDFYMDEVQRQQEDHLESLEFFGEMYMSLSILPMILLIIYLVMALMSGTQELLFFVTVYVGIPGLNILYILLVSTIKSDDPGDGTLQSDSGDTTIYDGTNMLSIGIVKEYLGRDPIFNRIRNEEFKYRIKYVLSHPWEYFRLNPVQTLVFTIPLTLAYFALMIGTGALRVDWAYTLDNHVWQTFGFFYLPFFINAVPLAIFYEWNLRTRGQIMSTLTEDLRKLANTNQTGQPLLESMRVTAEDSNSLLGREFMTMYKKVKYGRSLQPALIEFNNEYHIPRLARTVKLITKAQEASSQITDVLQTAAQASETQDKIAKERKSRTQMQVAVIAITFIIFLVVMAILKVMFIDRIVEMMAGEQLEGGQGFDPSQMRPNFLTTMYFHAVTLQGLCAGYISGYMQNANLYSGTKYAIAYLLVALSIWVLVV